MVLAAATSVVPAWLAAALVGITALGAIVNVVGGVLNGWLALRRIELLDKQRTAHEDVQHQELLDAVSSNQRGGLGEQSTDR